MRDARRAPLYIRLIGQSVIGRMFVFRVGRKHSEQPCMGWSMLLCVVSFGQMMMGRAWMVSCRKVGHS